jgi:fructose-bisphosphate aldolase class I
MFDETLFQSTKDGVQFVDVLKKQGIVPGIKVGGRAGPGAGRGGAGWL